jgi:transposase
MMKQKHTVKYPPEFRERGVRLYIEHRPDYPSDNAAYKGLSEKLGCSADTLRSWVKQAAIDAGESGGMTSDDRAHMKALEREVRELRQANEILRKASAYFAQAELDRPHKKW